MLPSSTTTTTATPSPALSPTTPTPSFNSRLPAGAEYDDDDYDSDEDTLPYPAPLPRSDFLSADFSPQQYLSTLHNRHQTLEDLRSDLRARSQDLSKELLDLVNGNYEEFLGLGSTLRGGDDKVEEVRLGVLGFKREVEGVKETVRQRNALVKELLDEKRKVRKDVDVGRKLLEVDEREDEDDAESEDEDGSTDLPSGIGTAAIARLKTHAQLYLLIQQMIDRIGKEHPFLVAQEPRMMKVRNTLLLDLGAALKQAKTAGSVGGGQTLKIIGLYRDLDESAEAVKVLRGG
ncbi:hypothetical protein H2203_002133 [Taxawa tesnikishii (nom. ined.)]|nr:hypothetical protein H2203_002133 [Dothideales sp. JES 119]